MGKYAHVIMVYLFLCGVFVRYGKVDSMETVLAFLEKIGNYLVLVRFSDILDVVIIAFLVYKLLDLVKSTRAENILRA